MVDRPGGAPSRPLDLEDLLERAPDAQVLELAREIERMRLEAGLSIEELLESLRQARTDDRMAV